MHALSRVFLVPVAPSGYESQLLGKTTTTKPEGGGEL
jgi:hypothetical protein